MHVVVGSGQATVVEATTLASYTTSCSGGANRVCTATISGPSAGARTVDLATGAVAAPVPATIRVTASGTNRYGVLLTGPAPLDLPLTVITSGSVRVD